jgi:TPP-dependent pyruvate/acetoin dehydrogenase alpha subunit
VLYESLNLASLWRAPILFVLENNRIAQTTPTEVAVAGSIAARFTAFGIPVQELDSSDIHEIYPLAGEQVDEVRKTQSPRALILHTCRFGPHSKGDDTRLPEAISALKAARDPLLIQSAHLEDDQAAQIRAGTHDEISTAFQKALADPFPTPERGPGSSL